MIFKEFIKLEEAFSGYVLSSLMSEVSLWINEARANRQQLVSKDFTYSGMGDNPADKIDRLVSDEGGSCPLTPLSGYVNHISVIQNFAHASPDNFAQVLMFSPLSANTPFAKHWDNFQMLMAILKYRFPDGVTTEKLKEAVVAFDAKYHKLTHTISGWKYDTIADIWNNRQNLYQELMTLSKKGDDVDLIRSLMKIKGAGAVKAGFMAQLLFGRAGCIDTHNIDIYAKVFPDMDAAGDFNEKKWLKQKRAAQDYVNVLNKLKSRGIGTKQLWDVWVDFVETMYVMVTHHGKGYYDYQGGVLNPDDPEYDALKGVSIPKWGIGKDRGGVMVPLATGRLGMGASAAHLPMTPDDALKHFYDLYSQGEIEKSSTLAKPDQLAARAVKFRKDPKTGKSLDQNLGKIPTMLHYLAPAVGPSGVDPKHIKYLINKRIQDKAAGD
jgi:hypothetical protein